MRLLFGAPRATARSTFAEQRRVRLHGHVARVRFTLAGLDGAHPRAVGKAQVEARVHVAASIYVGLLLHMAAVEEGVAREGLHLRVQARHCDLCIAVYEVRAVDDGLNLSLVPA